jgi:hypothetical protein
LNLGVLTGNERLVIRNIHNCTRRITKELVGDEMLNKLRLANSGRSIDNHSLYVVAVQEKVYKLIMELIEFKVLLLHMLKAIADEESKVLLAQF